MQLNCCSQVCILSVDSSSATSEYACNSLGNNKLRLNKKGTIYLESKSQISNRLRRLLYACKKSMYSPILSRNELHMKRQQGPCTG